MTDDTQSKDKLDQAQMMGVYRKLGSSADPTQCWPK